VARKQRAKKTPDKRNADAEKRNKDIRHPLKSIGVN
jgi:hypothetical protein